MAVTYEHVAFPPSPTPDDIFDFNSTSTMSGNKKHALNSRSKYSTANSSSTDIKVSNIPRSVKYAPGYRHDRNFSLSKSSESTSSPTETSPPLSPQNTGGNAVGGSSPFDNSAVVIKDESTVSLNGVDLSVDFPYLRATHSFDPKTLFEQHNIQQDASSVCLSFEHSDIIILHSVHPSGWGDASLLNNGRRGWVPTNFFTPYVETQAVSLLAAVLTFIINPRSLDIVDEYSKDTTKSTFSQTSINNIVAGVRSLLEMCNTLTRDSPIVKRSPAIRKFRKSLLTELALLVSVAKQNHNSTDSLVIEKLLHASYKIVIKAVIFLDVWQIETDAKSKLDDSEEADDDDSKSLTNGANSHSASFSQMVSAVRTKNQSSMNRASVIFLKEPPFASHRLEEVNEALTTYLGIFIHRMSILQTDPSASSQILFNTRKSMLACRELLACVEAISAHVNRDADLEHSKDTLYRYIRELVKVARQVANISLQDFENGEDEIDPDRSSHRKLVNTAIDCVRSAGECVVRSRNILQQIGDFHLTASREYPDFASGLMTNEENTSVRLSSSSSSLKYDTDGYDTATTTPIHSSSHRSDDSDDIDRDNKTAFLSQSTDNDAPGVQYETDDDAADDDQDDETIEEILYDDLGNLRGATAHTYLSMLVDGEKPLEAYRMSAFYLTFRTFMTPEDVLDSLFSLYEPDVDVKSLEETAQAFLIKKRFNIFSFIERWMKSHWVSTSDDAVLERILEFSGSRFDSAAPRGDETIRNLALKLQDSSSGAVVSRLVEINNEQEFFRQRETVPAPKKPLSVSLSKTQIHSLQKFFDQLNKSEDEQEGGRRQSSVSNWAASLRRGSNTSTGTVTASVTGNSSTVSLPPSINNVESNLTILDFDAADIACQLTCITFQHFCAITPNELVDQNFSLKKRQRGLAPNVAKMSTLTNSLSSYVGDSILKEGETGPSLSNKMRSKLLKQWIKIADKCCELGNFDATIAILSILQSVNITRLKKIWDMLPTKTQTMLDNLRYLLIPDRNFIGYRQRLKRQPLPAIPYLGLYFTDLTFVEEGNAKFKKSMSRGCVDGPKIINLDRCERIARLVGEFQRYQMNSYNIAPCKELQFWMQTEMAKSHQKILKDQQALWRRSCVLEPK